MTLKDLDVAAASLLVAQKTRHGRVAGAVGHALGTIDEDGLGLDDDVLLGGNALVLQIFQSLFRLVQLLLQGVTDTHQLVTFTHQTTHQQYNTMENLHSKTDK